MAVSLGINPITWTNDDMPELGGDIPLTTCLSETRIGGLRRHRARRQVSARRRRVAADPRAARPAPRLGLVQRAALPPIGRGGEDAVASHLDLLAAMGCNVMVFAEGHGSTDGDPSAPLSRRPVLSDAAVAGVLLEARTPSRRICTQRGVRLAFHHHMGTVVQTEAEVDRLMAHTSDDVGLLLDTGHLVFAGGDPVARGAPPRRAHRARPLQGRPRERRWPRSLRDDRSFLSAVLDGIFTVPGDGSIDFAAVLRELRPSGYAGWLVVEAEQDPAKAHPLTYARLGFDNLKRAAETLASPSPRGS